jgi:hypothetical protein
MFKYLKVSKDSGKKKNWMFSMMCNSVQNLQGHTLYSSLHKNDQSVNLTIC